MEIFRKYPAARLIFTEFENSVSLTGCPVTVPEARSGESMATATIVLTEGLILEVD
jgi:hypothetical protein